MFRPLFAPAVSPYVAIKQHDNRSKAEPGLQPTSDLPRHVKALHENPQQMKEHYLIPLQAPAQHVSKPLDCADLIIKYAALLPAGQQSFLKASPAILHLHAYPPEQHFSALQIPFKLLVNAFIAFEKLHSHVGPALKAAIEWFNLDVLKTKNQSLQEAIRRLFVLKARHCPDLHCYCKISQNDVSGLLAVDPCSCRVSSVPESIFS